MAKGKLVPVDASCEANTATSLERHSDRTCAEQASVNLTTEAIHILSDSDCGSSIDGPTVPKPSPEAMDDDITNFPRSVTPIISPSHGGGILSDSDGGSSIDSPTLPKPSPKAMGDVTTNFPHSVTPIISPRHDGARGSLDNRHNGDLGQTQMSGHGTSIETQSICSETVEDSPERVTPEHRCVAESVKSGVAVIHQSATKRLLDESLSERRIKAQKRSRSDSDNHASREDNVRKHVKTNNVMSNKPSTISASTSTRAWVRTTGRAFGPHSSHDKVEPAEKVEWEMARIVAQRYDSYKVEWVDTWEAREDLPDSYMLVSPGPGTPPEKNPESTSPTYKKKDILELVANAGDAEGRTRGNNYYRVRWEPSWVRKEDVNAPDLVRSFMDRARAEHSSKSGGRRESGY